MTLPQQFQILLFSFLYGFLMMMIFDLFNRMLFRQKGKLIRLVLEIFFFSVASLLYFIIHLFISNAIFNIFLPVFLILGIFAYIYTLQPYCLVLYDRIVTKFSKKIHHLWLSFSRKIDIIKIKIKAKGQKWYEKSRRDKTDTKT